LQTFVQPPMGFNPAAATDTQLREYGFPPRPRSSASGRALAAWLKAVRGPDSYLAPDPICGIVKPRSADGRQGDVPLSVAILAPKLAAFNDGRQLILGRWIKTTRQRAVSAQRGPRVAGGQRSVYFVVLHGHFSARRLLGSRGSHGRKAEEATVLAFTIDRVTGDILDVTLSNSSPNLSKIGAPHSFVIGSHGRTK
jgi:hypothetical protein